MRSRKLFSLLATSAVLILHAARFSSVEAKNWALILVGLDWYTYTYGYEAMAYKQYNDLVKNGIAPENIIVVSPDSAAFHPYNPLPGLIAYAYNRTDFSADGPVNQYEDVVIDYSSRELTMEHFFNIVSGTSNSNLTSLGSGRVIKSGPEDNIFIYVHTIGYEGFFLLNNRHLLYTDKFIPFVEDLKENKRFKKMFIHMHASYSGSMFDNYLDTDKQIVVYSLGGRYNEFTMCHPNKMLNAYTSSCQSFEHFSYLDKALSKNGAKETFLDLLHGSGLPSRDEEVVHNIYGDFSLATKPLKEFYGPKLKNSQSLTREEILEIKRAVKKETKNGEPILKRLTEDKSIPEAEQAKIAENVEKIVTESIRGTEIRPSVVNERVSHLPFKRFDCYRNSIETLRAKCLSEKSQFVFLKYASKFAKLCSLNVSEEKIVTNIKSVC